jgi:hypothetical protein
VRSAEQDAVAEQGEAGPSVQLPHDPRFAGADLAGDRAEGVLVDAPADAGDGLGGLLDEIAAAGYDVFVRRAAVPNRRRFSVALRSLLTAPGAL